DVDRVELARPLRPIARLSTTAPEVEDAVGDLAVAVSGGSYQLLASLFLSSRFIAVQRRFSFGLRVVATVHRDVEQLQSLMRAVRLLINAGQHGDDIVSGVRTDEVG